jgi:hypothetical protein
MTTRLVLGSSLLIALGCTQPTSVIIEPLRVINWSPSAGAFCVDVAAQIRITFSDDLDPASVTADAIVLRDSAGPIAGALTYDAVTFTARFVPDAPLLFETQYTAIVTTGVRGVNVGRMPVDLEAAFMTVPRYGCTPGVVCTYPTECPAPQICSSLGVCVDECVTDRDCYRATCQSGACVQDGDDSAPPGDPAGGDPVTPGDDSSGGDSTAIGD